jgi:hypothetical protein
MPVPRMALRKLGLILMAAYLASAQAPVAPGEPDERTLELQTLTDAAAAAPPEFAADVLITLVKEDLVPDRREQRRLIQEAFALGGSAPEKMQLGWDVRGPVGVTAVSTFAGGLDRVSLQARAAGAMLKLNAKMGREMFEQITLPLGERFSCEQPYDWQPFVYYRIMAEVVKSIPDPDDQAQFFQSHFSSLRSAAQVSPLAGVLEAFVKEQDGDTFTPVLNAFADRLAKLDNDSRIFTRQFPRASFFLLHLAAESPPVAREYLVQQIRAWVVRASSYGICAQRSHSVMALDGTISKVDPMDPVDRFNKELAPLSQNPQVIEAKEITRQLLLTASVRDSFSPEYLRFYSLIRLMGQESAKEKESVRWKSETEKLITAIIEFKDSNSADTDPAPHYLETAMLLQQVLGIQEEPTRATPAESIKALKEGKVRRPAEIMGRERVMRALADWCGSGLAMKVYVKRRIQWFGAFYRLMHSAERAPDIIELLAASNHPVVSLYAKLEQLKAKAAAAR